MIRILQRIAAFTAGLVLPLGAWALVADPTIDTEYASGSIVSMDQELVTADNELLNSDQVEPRVVRADHVVTDRIDDLINEVGPPKASASTCCIWIYFGGRWYCILC